MSEIVYTLTVEQSGLDDENAKVKGKATLEEMIKDLNIACGSTNTKVVSLEEQE